MRIHLLRRIAVCIAGVLLVSTGAGVTAGAVDVDDGEAWNGGEAADRDAYPMVASYTLVVAFQWPSKP